MTPAFSGDLSDSQVNTVLSNIGDMVLGGFLKMLSEHGKEKVLNNDSIKAAIEKYKNLALPIPAAVAKNITWAGGQLLHEIRILIKGDICCCTKGKYTYVKETAESNAKAYDVSVMNIDINRWTDFINNIANNLSQAYSNAYKEFTQRKNQCKK